MGAVILSPGISERLERAVVEYNEVLRRVTIGAPPVGCAIAMSALDELEDGVFDNVKTVAPDFQKLLSGVADHPTIGESRGIDIMGVLEIVAD